MSTIPELLEEWRSAVAEYQRGDGNSVGMLCDVHEAATDLINAYQGIEQAEPPAVRRHEVFLEALAIVEKMENARHMTVVQKLEESRKLAAFLLGGGEW